MDWRLESRCSKRFEWIPFPGEEGNNSPELAAAAGRAVGRLLAQAECDPYRSATPDTRTRIACTTRPFAADAAKNYSDERTFVVRVQPAFTCAPPRHCLACNKRAYLRLTWLVGCDRNLTFGFDDVEHTMCIHPEKNLTEGMARAVYQNMLHPPREQVTTPRGMMGPSWRDRGEAWHPWFHDADDRYV